MGDGDITWVPVMGNEERGSSQVMVKVGLDEGPVSRGGTEHGRGAAECAYVGRRFLASCRVPKNSRGSEKVEGREFSSNTEEASLGGWVLILASKTWAVKQRGE